MKTIIDQLIADLAAIDDRAELIAFLVPLRVPDTATNDDRARLTSAVIKAASRCWGNRSGQASTTPSARCACCSRPALRRYGMRCLNAVAHAETTEGSSQ